MSETMPIEKAMTNEMTVEESGEYLKKVVKEVEEFWRDKTRAAFDNAAPEEQKKMFYNLYDVITERRKYFGRIMFMFSQLAYMDSVNRTMFYDLIHLGYGVLVALQGVEDIPFIEKELKDFFGKYPELEKK